MHPDLLIAQATVYQPSNFTLEHFIQEEESQEYGASTFTLNGKRIIFRTSKITPTKIGQFVALWKRIDKGPIMPFDTTDHFDFCVISVRSGDKFGQFVFSKTLLCEKGIISENGIGGKRAIRVYPPWDIPDNKQAAKTQAWQAAYFFPIDCDNTDARQSMLKLFA